MSAALDSANADQSAYWNGDAGRRWAQLQESQDRLFTPITAALLEAASLRAGEGVVDVGCGAGETTLRAAEVTGRALGVDLSEALLSRARERARGSPARFARADATAYDFSAEAADLMISRFGVMFFAEPAKSFANLRRALKPGGRLVFVCWREPAHNSWLILPYKAAKPHLPPQTPVPPDAPGPFAFADAGRVRGVLSAAGFSEVSLTPRDFRLDVADGGGLAAAVEKSMQIGPLSRALDGQPPEVADAARGAVNAVLSGHAEGGAVLLDAGVWIVRARA